MEVVELITKTSNENGHVSPNGDSPDAETFDQAKAEASEEKTESEPTGASD